MTSPRSKTLVLDGKTLPRLYADQFIQVSYGASIAKVTLAIEVDNEIRPVVELAMPTDNFVNGLKFMLDSFDNPELKKTMITDLERMIEALKK